ncbi:MAG TPA: hypothetical protein VF275_11565 [Gammaproteobacteria bacterium]
MTRQELALFFTEYAWFWFGSSLLLFFMVCAVTLGSFTRQRRNLLRAAVFALLLTPFFFGVHDVVFFFPAWILLLDPSLGSLAVLGGMAVIGAIVFGLLSFLPEKPTHARELGLIIMGTIALIVAIVILAVIAAISGR